MSPDELAKALAHPGRASIPYLDRYNPERPLVLECFRAQAHHPDNPVVIVQHGASRNGAEYCEAWLSAAERHGLLIVAITFSKEAWPEAVTYNNGHVLANDAGLRPREYWSLAIPGRVFARLREAGITRRDKTYLWGHSAGEQFVHRLFGDAAARYFRGGRSCQCRVVHIADPRPCLPRWARRHRADERRYRSFSGYPLVIFSGDQDIDGRTENFPKHDAAMAQGPNRFARAQFYLERGRAEAAMLGAPCRWSRVVVPGVAHEGMRMSAFAGDYWFGGKS